MGEMQRGVVQIGLRHQKLLFFLFSFVVAELVITLYYFLYSVDNKTAQSRRHDGIGLEFKFLLLFPFNRERKKARLSST